MIVMDPLKKYDVETMRAVVIALNKHFEREAFREFAGVGGWMTLGAIVSHHETTYTKHTGHYPDVYMALDKEVLGFVITDIDGNITTDGRFQRLMDIFNGHIDGKALLAEIGHEGWSVLEDITNGNILDNYLSLSGETTGFHIMNEWGDIDIDCASAWHPCHGLDSANILTPEPEDDEEADWR